MPFMSVTDEISQESRGWLKVVAPPNMPFMSVTLETSHSEMSPLKEDS